QSLEQRITHGPYDVAVRAEVHAVIEHDLVTDHTYLLFIGAAVMVGIVVRRFCLVGTKILRVGHAVLVVVIVGTAVLVLEAVSVFRIVRALIFGVDDPVFVVVVVGTAVAVLEAVLVFGHHRAIVMSVDDAVFVVVVVDRKSTRLNSSHVKISYAVF